MATRMMATPVTGKAQASAVPARHPAPAMRGPSSHGPGAPLLDLQRAIGNRATTRLIQRQSVPPTSPPSAPTVPCDRVVTTPGHPLGTNLFFGQDKDAAEGSPDTDLNTFVKGLGAGLKTAQISVHGYASIEGDPGYNLGLSCSRALAIERELVGRKVPSPNITTVAHGPTTEFSTTALGPNRRVIVSSSLTWLPPGSDPEPTCGPPPQCPRGDVVFGGDAPLPINPFIPGGGLCRGACGRNCPRTCRPAADVTICVSDMLDTCHYSCVYENVLDCPTHEGCRVHDACYDVCEAQGEPFGFPRGPCHAACDQDCIDTYGQIACFEWQGGQGGDDWLRFSDRPVRSEPTPGPCP